MHLHKNCVCILNNSFTVEEYKSKNKIVNISGTIIRIVKIIMEIKIKIKMRTQKCVEK